MVFGSLLMFFRNLCRAAILFVLLLLSEIVQMIELVAWCIGFSRKPTPHGTGEERYQALVEDNIPAVKFEKGLSTGSDDCAVCLCKIEEGDEIRPLPCEHKFHKDCMDKWLERDARTCPLCRRTVVPEEVLIKHWHRERDRCNEEQFGLFFPSFHGSTHHGLVWAW